MDGRPSKKNLLRISTLMVSIALPLRLLTQSLRALDSPSATSRVSSTSPSRITTTRTSCKSGHWGFSPLSVTLYRHSSLKTFILTTSPPPLSACFLSSLALPSLAANVSPRSSSVKHAAVLQMARNSSKPLQIQIATS